MAAAMICPSEKRMNFNHFLFSLPILFALTACQSLPDLQQRSVSSHLDLPAPVHRNNPFLPAPAATAQKQSDIYLLDDPQDAFLARVALIQSAQSSLDIQYYIWHPDVSGKLLFAMLQQAARRGVRVRLLLDDNNTVGSDDLLALLDREPNIEIRLFNPFLNRRLRTMGYLTDFPRLNRRMHNKSLTADNQATITGGRNIGDEYFNITTQTGFADLDILAHGPIVADIETDFDRYWASGSSYPFAQIAPHADPARGQQQLADALNSDGPTLASYQQTLQTADLADAIRKNRIPWVRAEARLISDDPAKGLARGKQKANVLALLYRTLSSPQRELYIISPYFVPTRPGLTALSQLSDKGVRITVLTNSLQATDVAAVHSGYARYREDLLKSGITLYELKATHAVPKLKDRGLTGSSSTSLHAKTFIVDQQRVFIGSFNFDPRSVRLNTEMGVLIESPVLAKAMQTSLHDTVPQYAYALSLNSRNKLQWTDPDTRQTSRTEPAAGFWKRLSAKLLALLPIEHLL